MKFAYAIIASFVVSLISLIGAVALVLSDKLLKKIILFLVAFAAGGLIGGAFLEIIPEGMEYVKDPTQLFLYVILGFLFFFILEKYLHWRHCHNAECTIHMFTYLNIVGDAVHNFSDGLIIGAIFMVDIRVGIATTLAIVFHEIPHELGNFMVLVYGGFSKLKALLFNFISALFAMAGTIVGFYFASAITGFAAVLLPMAAGGFIYIAACDLIPELHKETDIRKSALTLLSFALGLGLMYVIKIYG